MQIQFKVIHLITVVVDEALLFEPCRREGKHKSWMIIQRELIRECFGLKVPVQGVSVKTFATYTRK